MRALVIIPTYNERENIDLMVGQIEAVGLDLDCLFVDDGSPDGTGEKIVSISRARPWIRLLQRGSKKGIGSAHLDGISWARGNGYQTVITMDCDLTHSPSDIPAMLKAAEDADVVVGSRYMRKGSLAGWNWYRKALTRTAHLLTRFLLGIRHDSTGAFRIYRLDRLPPTVFDLVQSKNYAFFFESLFLLANNGAAIVEVPISLPPRTRKCLRTSRSEGSVISCQSPATGFFGPRNFGFRTIARKLDPRLWNPGDGMTTGAGRRRPETASIRGLRRFTGGRSSRDGSPVK